MNKRFVLQKSATRPNGWVVTDTVHNVVLQFTEGNFNDSQEVTLLNEHEDYDWGALARFAREIGEWVNRYHAELCFSNPYVLRYTVDDRPCVARHKHPRFTIEFHMSTEEFVSTPAWELRDAIRGVANKLGDGILFDDGERISADDKPIEVVALESISSEILRRELKKVAAFVNNKCRGYVED